MAQRVVSYSEVATALTCWARHDFRYGGRLAGDALHPKMIPMVLSRGSAWGAGVATWHASGGRDRWGALLAMLTSLRDDERKMRDAGFPVSEAELVAEYDRLGLILDDYITRSEPFTNLRRLEESVVVPLPSRWSGHSSSRYKFEARIDGWTLDADGRAWVVEFKLRGGLHSVGLVQLSRQIRWYAWALRQAHGITPVGVITEERLNEQPHEPRIVQARKKADGIDGRVPSHSADQLCTPDAYVAACADYNVVPEPRTIDALARRQWQQRVPLMFTARELDEAGQELVSAAKLIGELDAGRLQPIRNVSPMNCRSCDYFPICAQPQDHDYVDTLYERVAPKRLREPAPKVAA